MTYENDRDAAARAEMVMAIHTAERMLKPFRRVRPGFFVALAATLLAAMAVGAGGL